MDEYLALDRENKMYSVSKKKAMIKTKEMNLEHTHAHMWFTNLPSRPVGVSGIAGYAGACLPEEKTSLIRGPHRGILETAGVTFYILISCPNGIEIGMKFFARFNTIVVLYIDSSARARSYDWNTP